MAAPQFRNLQKLE